MYKNSPFDLTFYTLQCHDKLCIRSRMFCSFRPPLIESAEL